MNKFDREFKLMAVELLNSGKSSTQIGKELGIGHDTARRWKDQFDLKHGRSSGGKPILSKEQEEVLHLKKQLREVKLERDILKKVVRIFSKSDGENSDL